MSQIRYVLGGRPVNPLMRIFGAVIGLIIFVVAVIVGGFVLAALIGLALIAWAVIYARFWWLSRKARQNMRGPGAGRDREESIVEAEYRVIETRSRDADRGSSR